MNNGLKKTSSHLVALAVVARMTGMAVYELITNFTELCPAWFEGEGGWDDSDSTAFDPESWARSVTIALRLGAVRTTVEAFDFDGAPPVGTLRVIGSGFRMLAVIGLRADGTPISTTYTV